MSPGPVCGAGDSLHPLVTLPATIRLNPELRPAPSKQRAAMKVSDNDFVLRVSCGAAEATDPRQSKAVHRSIKKRLVVFLISRDSRGRPQPPSPPRAEHSAGVRGGHLLRGRTLGLLPGTSKEYMQQH